MASPSPSRAPVRPPLHSPNSGTITTLNDLTRSRKNSVVAPPVDSAPSTSIIPASALPTSGEPISCNGCKLGLEETSDSVVVSFGSSLWHVDCRCAKCSNLVEHDTNLLLLSDGSPVCENCSYICSVCSKPISNEAIVTGDESYHADCFRCRSCSNKIEELIFAKTSQGIWCMSCHNDRVARSRKHAEAKRSRSIRKDKEARSGKSRVEKERNGSVSLERERNESVDLVGPGEPPLSAASTTGNFDPSQFAPTTPAYAPSPSRSQPNSISIPSTSTFPQRPPKLSPKLSPTAGGTRFFDEQFAADYRPSQLGRSVSPSSQSLASIARGPAPHPLPSPKRTDLPSPRSPFDSPRHSETPPYTRKTSVSARSGSLSAPTPVDKGSNRRSGFYGAMARAAAAEEAATNATPRKDSNAGPPSPSRIIPENDVDEDPLPSAPITPPATAPSTTSFLPELHKSMSFYDPDTLLFLDHVGSEGNQSPRGSVSTGRHSIPYHNGIASIASEQVERLSADLTEQNESSDEDGFPHERHPPSKVDVSRKVRESIGRSRGEGGEQGMAMDVDLVEMLLAELDGTKNEMQDLQTKYNAFRRASRSAFEGFSMAQQEYDKEVVARRDTERRMDLLRARFTEQALKLAAVDKEQKVADALNRRSKELRLSVVGMEKHLSKLKAEVELSTAQVEELVSVEREDGEAKVDSSTVTSHTEIAKSLSARLELVKDQHRREIEALIKQRDDLSAEVGDLRRARENYLEEGTSLNRQNSLLAQQNTEAARQLESTRDAVSKLRAPSPLSGGRSHQYSSSTTSSFVNPSSPLPRSPLFANRTSPSPQPDYESESSRQTKVNSDIEPHPAVVKKFKWGKGKVESNRAPAMASGSQGGSVSKSSGVGISNATARSTGSSTELSSRTHIFQQTSILRPVKCDYCGDKMWGLNEVRCTVCGGYCHTKCAGYLTSPCSAHAPTAQDEAMAGNPNGHVMFGCDLTVQALVEGRQIPVVVTKCIEAVEAFGMNYEGVYRKSGGNGQTKLITQCFERGQDFDLQDLDKFNDLAAVTSCMKNFFRSLPDPLFTYELHENFVSCTEMPDGEAKLNAVEDTLYELPEVHFYTARMLIGHLHRIHLDSAENKMTPANLGVVFGPTVLRSRDPTREFSDMGSKAKLVELFVENYPRLFARPYPPPH